MSRLTKPFRHWLLITVHCLLIISISSCSPSNSAPTATLHAIPTLTPTLDISTRTAPAPDTATPDTETLSLPHYTFNVTLDYRRRRLTVEETIVYPNATGDALNDLVLAVMPNIWPSVFKLNKLELNGAPAKNYKLDKQRLTIQLPAPLPPEGTAELFIAYSLSLPEIQAELSTEEVLPQFFGYTSRQMNLANWYPFIVPHDAGGWILHDPWYFGEHLVYDTADFEVNIKHAEEGVRPTIVASAVGEPNGAWTRFTLNNARTFAFSASTEFQRSVTNAGDVFVYSYYFPGNESAGEAAAVAAADAIEVFSQRFGPYPHKSLTIVMSDFNDGAEFSAFFFLSKGFYRTYDSTRANYLTFISAHETAHQWWFEQVANDQYLEPWLDEALCTYSEHIFYETTDLPLLDWWWGVRVDAYTPHGTVDIPLNTEFENEMYRQYVNATYLRGARFLDDLRNRMGDEAFFAFLQDYLNQFKGKRATTEDFFTVLRQHTNTDISDLMNEYFQDQH